MTHYQSPLRDMQFLIYDVWQSQAFWHQFPEWQDLDRETADAILTEAAKICEDVIAPLNARGDEQGCQWQEGEVRAPEGFAKAYETYAQGGWIGLGGNPEYGGMGMPKSLVSAVEEMLQGACMALGLAPMLSSGACLAIDAHGSDELKALYLPKLYGGEWSGAMDLTEPHAGTDLGLIRTRAEPCVDGSYRLTGTKIFITWGEHDMAENIVHLVLAKLPDAPAGSKGISMFLVPKYVPDEGGAVGERNGLSCGSLEKKMGIKGAATCVMNFEEAKGWLVGESNQGLACMFTMMNYERLVVGIQAMGAAEASYQNARAYAKERLQSRSASGVTNADGEADPILVHGDVRRMLLTMKAYNEASRAFYVYTAQWLDAAKYATDPGLKTKGEQLVALLTPVAKAFISDMAFDTTVMGQQVFGGHGYVREWGQEQLVRDVRITQIYEGTNGIQAMDLVGRKTLACRGKLAAVLIGEIVDFIEREGEQLRRLQCREALSNAVSTLQSATDDLIARGEQDPELAGAVANDYLYLLGHVVYAFVWGKMACAAGAADDGDAFFSSKIKTCRFYYQKLLPQVAYWAARIQNGSASITDLSEEEF